MFSDQKVKACLLLSCIILFVTLLLPFPSTAKILTCNRMPTLMEGFLSHHYAAKSLTKQIKSQSVDQMIKSVDPARTLLYATDVEWLKPVLHDLFTTMQSGNCASLKPVYDMLVARARENEAMVKKILGPGYRLDETLELHIDVKKRPYAKTVAEKQALLKKMVQFQIENALLNGIDLAQAKKKQIHHYELQTKRVLERDPERLVTIAAESFAQALDPHTSYLSAENYEDLQIHMRLSLEGIGAVLSHDNGFTVIEEMIPGGGAERSGLLKPKDKIIAVAQEKEKPVDVIDMDLREVVRMIRGKKGTKVTLTILRQAESANRFEVAIIRDKVNIKEQEAKMTYETRTVNGRVFKFGIIELPSFYGDENENRSSFEDVRNFLTEAKRQGVDGIVLDLSRNGGGVLSEAVQLAGLFIGRGGIVAIKGSDEQVTILANGSASLRSESQKRRMITFPAENIRTVYSGPLVVLTSRMSASASEIVAGALKDYRRAVIVGSDHTFGKGSVQSLTPLSRNMGSMKVTTALYFLPGGKSTQKVGVEADVRLPFWFVLEDVGEMSLDYPLPAQEIAPFLDLFGNSSSIWKPLEPAMLAELASRSLTRVSKDPQFIELIKSNAEALDKKGVIRLSDLRKEAKKQGNKKGKETTADLKKKARDQYAPFINESVNVLLDVIALTPPLPASPSIQAAAPGSVFSPVQ